MPNINKFLHNDNAVACVCFNSRSIINKLHELPLFLQSLRIMPKICAITETWLRPKDDDILFTSIVPEYNLYRADRQGRGGGVALLCHNSVVCISPKSECVDGIESIWSTLHCLLLEQF